MYGTCRNAGTDAGVSVDIIGDRGSSGPKQLVDLTKDTFERAQVDDFKIGCRALGQIRKLRIAADGRGKAWHLAQVVITSAAGEKYFFGYNNWLGEWSKAQAVELDASLLDPALAIKTYKVRRTIF